MAMPEASPAPSARVVGNAFVEQYYHILHQSPELVHRFYHDSSLLSRPDSDGVMTTVTTMQAINDKILSLKYQDYTAEIRTADAQDSHEKGVIVLITGCLTGKDNVRKKFAQTFFLAPQDKGYFVLNDVFRYVEENESSQISSIPIDGVDENASVATLTPEPEPIPVVAPTAHIDEEGSVDGAEVCDPSDDEGSVIEEEVVESPTEYGQNEDPAGQNEDHAGQNEDPTSDNSVPASLEDTPKKSYASIVKVMKSTPGPVYVPTGTAGTVRAPASTADKQSVSSVKPASAPEAAAVTSHNAPESSSVADEAEGHSIYVRNLPFNATVTQLEEVFKPFGAIKSGGIQVRSNKQGFTFGFVEFEALSSMQSALEATSVTIGDCQAVVEEKRTSTRVVSSGRGKFSTGRGGFRNDNFRSRGNFGGGGGRGYGRSEFRNQGEYTGRSRSSSGRNGEGYQRVNQNGSGRGGGRQGGGNRTSFPA